MSSESSSSFAAAPVNQPSFFTFCQVKMPEIKLDEVDPAKEIPEFQLMHDKLVELWTALTPEERNMYQLSAHADISTICDNSLPMNELKKAAFSTISASDIMVNPQQKKRKSKSAKAELLGLNSVGDITTADLSTSSPPYLLFCFEKRKEIKMMYPQSSIAEQSHLLEQMWSSLDYVNKQEYVLKARKNASLQSSSTGAAGSGGGSSLSAKAAQFIKKANMTAYITFCTLRRNEVKTMYPSASSFSAIGKLLGWLWAKITDEEKKYYDGIAAKLNAETNKRNELIQEQLKILYDQQQQQLQEQYVKSHVKMTSMYPTNSNHMASSSFNFPGAQQPNSGRGGHPNAPGAAGHKGQHMQQQPPPYYNAGHPGHPVHHNPYGAHPSHMGGMNYQGQPHQMNDMMMQQQMMQGGHPGQMAAGKAGQRGPPQMGGAPPAADKKRRKGAAAPMAAAPVVNYGGHYPGQDMGAMGGYDPMNMYAANVPQVAAVAAGAAGKRQPPSAYITFCTMKRTEVRTIFPDASFGDLGKILGMLWGAMSEESRAEYLQIAQSVEENQKNLNQNMNQLQQQQNDWSLRCKLPTAFALFCEDVRPMLIQRCPAHDPVETIKIFTAEWGYLNHHKKEEYIQKAATNEAIELAKFHQQTTHVKKQAAPSAYLTFAGEKRKELLQENPSLNFQEIGRMCGQIWRDLSPEDKAKWNTHAIALANAGH